MNEILLVSKLKVHSDIKPDNLIVFPGNRIKLTDLGIAKPAKTLRFDLRSVLTNEFNWFSWFVFAWKKPTWRIEILLSARSLFWSVVFQSDNNNEIGHLVMGSCSLSNDLWSTTTISISVSQSSICSSTGSRCRFIQSVRTHTHLESRRPCLSELVVSSSIHEILKEINGRIGHSLFFSFSTINEAKVRYSLFWNSGDEWS